MDRVTLASRLQQGQVELNTSNLSCLSRGPQGRFLSNRRFQHSSIGSSDMPSRIPPAPSYRAKPQHQMPSPFRRLIAEILKSMYHSH